jgi:chloride channel protein, CIC family
MDTDVALVPAETRFDAFLRAPGHEGRIRFLRVMSRDRIVGVQRVNTALHRGLEESNTGLMLGDIANRNFVIARGDDIVFDTIRRMWRRGAFVAVVVRKVGCRAPTNVWDVISKEHAADSVAETIQTYPG